MNVCYYVSPQLLPYLTQKHQNVNVFLNIIFPFKIRLIAFHSLQNVFPQIICFTINKYNLASVWKAIILVTIRHIA